MSSLSLSSRTPSANRSHLLRRAARSSSPHHLPALEWLEPRRLLSAYNPQPVPLITLTEGVSNGVTVETFACNDPLANLSATVNWPGGATTVGTIATVGSVFVPGIGTIPQYKVTTTFLPSATTSISQPQLTVTVHDASDATNSVVVDTMQVIATPISFVTSAGPSPIAEGLALQQYEIAIFSDPDGSAGSNDFVGTIDWGDGTPVSAALIASIGSQDFAVFGDHTYKEATGPFTPRITVTDASGQTIHTIAGPITVNDAPLIPGMLQSQLIGVEGQTLTGQLIGAFTDLNPNATPADFTTFISWGDGTGTDLATGEIRLAGGSSGQSHFLIYGTHTYATAARTPYSITITVQDSDGGNLNSLTSSAAIAHRDCIQDALFASGNDISGLSGQVVTGTVAFFSDANVAALPTNFAAAITWGDGKTTAGNIVNDGNGNFEVTGSHAYAKEKANGYPISVKISTVAGTKTSASTTATAHIADAPFTAGNPLTLNVARNKGFNLVLGAFTDQDALNTKPADYINPNSIIDWGDGTTTKLTAANFKRTGSNPAIGSFWNVVGGHKYTTPGQKSVTIALLDNGGQATTLTLTITVN